MEVGTKVLLRKDSEYYGQAPGVVGIIVEKKGYPYTDYQGYSWYWIKFPDYNNSYRIDTDFIKPNFQDYTEKL